MRQLLLALVIMTCSVNMQALFSNHLSDEDQATITNLNKDIASLEGQENEEEYFAYLQFHRDFMLSIIRRINFLMYKYPDKPIIQDFTPARDYLQRTMARFGLLE